MGRRPTVVFDFDGTLASGDGPVLAYARHVAAAAGDEGIVAATVAALDLLDAGDGAYLDGYDAVRRVALAHGVDEGLFGSAYLASRLSLGTDAAPVVTPPGLAGFLAELGGHARVVVATNAPATGVERVLATAGAGDLVDECHFTVGKPAGLAAVVAGYLAEGPVLAVGDIWEYDLAPADELGADTALVGLRHARTDVRPTMRGATLADLYGEITAWAATAAAPGPSVPADVDHLHGKA